MSSSNFPKLKLKQYAKIQERETSEANYWKSFSSPKEDLLQSSPTCIDFNPVDNGSYLVTGSVKLSLYDAQSDKVQRAYTRFTDDAFSGKFRRDGKLIVAGDKASNVKVFDVPSKALLRTMKGHNAAVRCTTWACDGRRIYSGSDDKRALCWDLATEQQLFSTGDAHSDYIRALDASPVSADVFVTGGYDHCVNVWDSRQSSGAAHALRLGHPVECCLFSPSGTMLLTASGSEVRVYDVISGGKLLHTFNNHQKYVTSLCMDGTSSRLLSAGLDGHIKIYSLQTLQVVHGMKLGAPLTSLAMCGQNRKMVVGFVNGTVMARTRRPEAKGSLNMNLSLSSADAHTNVGPASIGGTGITAGLLEQHAAQLQQNRFFKGAGLVHTYSSAGSGGSGGAGEGASTQQTERTARLQPYERLLKKFNYQATLDAALKTRNPLVVITVLEELCLRDGLGIALSGRDEASLEPLVSFSARYVNHPKYSKLVVQVVQKVIDLYASMLGHSEAIDELFLKLHKQVRAEVGFQRQILRVMGSLDGIISAATMPKHTDNSTLELP
ncbi:WD40-repeat-containing domain protein [Ochromonadaceae sp. CCMP2298]|nr:WD40-repeat-containing domain protein [Ochromonadaceae sp. CCMP2298]|mmetsp:Transcript_22593/g.50244  ORF Transcript_22593/g.50244 Transcript_22593/m.50244 type:complete len:552 (+) Transcript_22593:91-1746(+)